MKCYACARKLGQNPFHAATEDDQIVKVGTECRKLIVAAEVHGSMYQPPKGGPRLRTLRPGEFAAYLKRFGK